MESENPSLHPQVWPLKSREDLRVQRIELDEKHLDTPAGEDRPTKKMNCKALVQLKNGRQLVRIGESVSL